MNQEIQPGDTVKVEYTTVPNVVYGRKRSSLTTIVSEVLGEIVYLHDYYHGDDDLTLVIDPEGDMWARETGKPSTDGLFGTNTQITKL